MTNARLFEPTALPDHGLAVGLAFIQGAGFRVAAQSAGEMRHMSPAAARRLAREFADGEEAAALAPVSKALIAAADRLDLLNTAPAGAA